jgi:hypothetical protein
MLRIKQCKFIWLGLIVLGVILLAMPSVYAADDFTEGVENGFTDEELDDLDDLEAFGDIYEDLVYTPVNPCKIVDTRYGGGGFISAGSTRYYKVYGSLSLQGGSTCNTPVSYPSAAHLAVTVVNPDGKGNVKVFPWGASGTTGLQINFAPIGTNLANAGTTRVYYGSSSDIGVRTQYAGAHVTIQVLGYYTRPEATQLQAYSTYASRSVAWNTLGVVYSPICRTGYVATGGGCSWQYDWNEIGTTSRPYPASGIPNRWECRGFHNRIGFQNLTTYVVCSRIPGR